MRKPSACPRPTPGSKLNKQEIELIRLWIEQGARWQRHWSFIPPERPPLPEVADEGWTRNPIDFFVLDRLRKEQLDPLRPGRQDGAHSPGHPGPDGAAPHAG